MLLKIRAAVQSIHALEQPGIGGISQGFIQFLAGPNIESSFHSTGLGIEGGIESSFGIRQLPFYESQRFLHYPPIKRPRIQAVSVGVHFPKLGIVIEHLFEMRHGPRALGAVTMETAAELIVNASPSHAVQRNAHGL